VSFLEHNEKSCFVEKETASQQVTVMSAIQGLSSSSDRCSCGGMLPVVFMYSSKVTFSSPDVSAFAKYA